MTHDWQPIETAPKGGGAEDVRDPLWVEPSRILLAFPDGHIAIGKWDWYYAEGGRGFQGQAWAAWVETDSGELLDQHGPPVAWMPLPAPPVEGT